MTDARSGEEALALVRRRGGFDVMVTDHLMPGMTGVELARAVAAVSPAMPVLITSGYSDAVGLASDMPRLEKPFREAELAAALARIVPAAIEPILIVSDTGPAA